MSKKSKAVVLIVDDAPEILSLLSIRLQKAGYDVIEATDGEEALVKAREKMPDLMVLDVMMPGMNGWEVARELRRDARFKDMGIVVLTAIGEKINEMTSPLYGADDFIDKPFEFSDLEEKIRNVLKKKGK
ncbi:MAG: response regulator [Pseudomonadota bacterium]